MSSTFSVTLPAESRTLRPGRDGKASVTYTVTNSKTHPAQGRVLIVPQDGTAREWFSFPGEAEQDFRGEESQQFKVLLAIPADTPTGSYGFRIDVANVANPQEDFTEGETVAFAWEPPPPTKRRPTWLIPAVAAGAITVLACVAAFVFWPTPKPPKAKNNTIQVDEDGE